MIASSHDHIAVSCDLLLGCGQTLTLLLISFQTFQKLGRKVVMELELLALIGPKTCIDQIQNDNKQMEGLWLLSHVSIATD